MRQTVNELAPHVADKVEPELTVIIPVFSEEATLSALFCLYTYAVSTLAEGQNLSHEAFHVRYGEHINIKDLG
jgi:hypothetical protein